MSKQLQAWGYEDMAEGTGMERIYGDQKGLGRVRCHWAVWEQAPVSKDEVSRSRAVHKTLKLPHLFVLSFLY